MDVACLEEADDKGGGFALCHHWICVEFFGELSDDVAGFAFAIQAKEDFEGEWFECNGELKSLGLAQE